MDKTTSEQDSNRSITNGGQFQKGKSGNPGGKPQVTARKKAPAKPPAVQGRPKTFTPDWHVPKAEALCRLGATQAQIADIFDVDVRTVEKWRVQYPDFNRALKVGGVPADDAVEMTLYRRALGYQTVETEKTYELAEVEDPETGELKVFKKLTGVKEKVREVPPDTTAALFWLKNRRPEQWRESYQHTVVDADEITTEQLAKQLMFTFRQYAEEGGDVKKLMAEKTQLKRDE